MGNKMCACKEEKPAEPNNLDINGNAANSAEGKAAGNAAASPQMRALGTRSPKNEAEQVRPVVIHSVETQALFPYRNRASVGGGRG